MDTAVVGKKPPSLVCLCLEALAAALTRECEESESGDAEMMPQLVVDLLPCEELLHRLASLLPPSALQSLHHHYAAAAHARSSSCSSPTSTAAAGNSGTSRRGTKRSRCDCQDFNLAWQALFRLRWPLQANTGHQHDLLTLDWQQLYWENHLQQCLDEAAETALLPSFHGSIVHLTVSDKIMSFLYHNEGISHQHSTLSYHCSKFGCYARCLRLQNVLCTAQICGLLQHIKLEKLMFIRIISKPEVDGVCLLLSCHAKTLLSIEFIHCQLYPAVMDNICNSVCQKGSLNHGIQHFSIKSSRISESNVLTTSAGLLSFLSSGKSLHSLSLNDTKMQSSFAKMIIHTLLKSSCGLQMLEISENNIAGWLSRVDKTPTSFSSALESNVSLNSLTVLNLRGNNLNKGDAEDLCNILVKMPNLRSLDISDNPIMDSGIRLLIPFFARALQKENPLSKLRVENCDLSSIGVAELLECLISSKKPADMLSIADNHLGSSVASALAKFLGSRVRELNVEDIGLGALGFQILEEALPREVALTHINISKNRGGISTAHFVSRLILQAPRLVSVNAGANLLPPESLEVICNALKQMTCNLERLDLTGNMHLSVADFPAVLGFKKHGKPIVVVPSQQGTSAPYDDDP